LILLGLLKLEILKLKQDITLLIILVQKHIEISGMKNIKGVEKE
jgi:hypothetical protein